MEQKFPHAHPMSDAERLKDVKVMFLDLEEQETLEKLIHAERERITLERENGADDTDNVEESTVTHFPDVDMTFAEWEKRILDLEVLLGGE